jgi:hypothetical protein
LPRDHTRAGNRGPKSKSPLPPGLEIQGLAACLSVVGC